MKYSEIYQKTIICNGKILGICVGLFEKNNIAKYVICKQSKEVTCFLYFSQIEEITMDGIIIKKSRKGFPTNCNMLEKNKSVYYVNGEYIGKTTDYEFVGDKLVYIYLDNGRKITTNLIYAFSDAVILLTDGKYPVGIYRKENNEFINKRVLKDAMKKGELIELTLSLSPFDFITKKS